MKEKSLLGVVLGYVSWGLVCLWEEILDRAIAMQHRRLVSRLGSCGEGVGLYGRVKIACPEKVKIGNNVHINDNAWIRAEGGVEIGDNTHISRNLVLYSMNHNYEGGRLPYDEESVCKPVLIGRNVWIGMNVCIAPGTIIEDGAIVGLGAVVSGRVPAMSIVGSAPWRVLKHRNVEHYRRLDSAGEYGAANGRPPGGTMKPCQLPLSSDQAE